MAVNYANRGYDGQGNGYAGASGFSNFGSGKTIAGWSDAIEMGRAADHERAMELARLQQSGSGDENEFLKMFMSKDYLDPKQYRRATGRYKGALDDIDSARGFSTDIARNGGIGDDEFNSLMGQYGEDRNRFRNVADNGILSQGEFGQIVDSSQQAVMDQYRNAAASTFNANNMSNSPFAGAAVMAGGAREAGAERAKVFGDTMRYQADSKMAGMAGMKGLLDSETGARMGRADNRITGAGQLNDLAKTSGSIAGSLADLDARTIPGYMKRVASAWGQGNSNDNKNSKMPKQGFLR